MRKQMNHVEYPENLKRRTSAELLFIMKDASEAAQVSPEGENVGYYLDEVHYAGMELKRRDKTLRFMNTLRGA